MIGFVEIEHDDNREPPPMPRLFECEVCRLKSITLTSCPACHLLLCELCVNEHPQSECGS